MVDIYNSIKTSTVDILLLRGSNLRFFILEHIYKDVSSDKDFESSNSTWNIFDL